MNNGMKVIPVTAIPSMPERNTIYQIGTTLSLCDPDGNIVPLTTSPITGQTTLVAGTKAVVVPGLLTTSLAFVQLVSAAHASTVERAAVCTAGTLTITALLAAKTINAADVAVVNYVIFI